MTIYMVTNQPPCIQLHDFVNTPLNVAYTNNYILSKLKILVYTTSIKF